MSPSPPDLRRQIDYYRARAAEYDEWFERRGRYDHGDAHRRLWRSEADEVREILDDFAPRGDVLELAGGTGLWTERLLRHASRLRVLDASEEMLDLNRIRCLERAHTRGVDYETRVVDIFAWEPERRWDVIFFSFWLSHVPESHFDPFWSTIRRALRPKGRAFLIDSKLAPNALAHNHPQPDLVHETALRRLNDGREFEIVKRFYQPGELGERLKKLGFAATVTSTRNFFIVGQVRMT